MLKRLLFLVVLAAGLIAGLWYSQRRVEPPKVSGFIEADDIRVGSRVGGRVAKVGVVEGQRVEAGDKLIELDAFDLPQRRAEAEANRARLEAQLAELIAGPRKQDIEAARGYLASAEAARDLAQVKHNQIKSAFDRNAASRDELDEATANLKGAAAMLDVRRAELSVLQEGTRPEQIAAARAAVDAAANAIDAIDVQLAELVVTAPVAGEIEAVDLRPGDLVAPNAPTLSMIDTSRLWVRAYLPENRLAYAVGDRMTVTVDSFPGRSFAAHVTYIARQAEFTPGNVQTPEDRSKQVFRIKVTLDEGLDVLRPGMNADVWLDRQPAKPADTGDTPNAAKPSS